MTNCSELLLSNSLFIGTPGARILSAEEFIAWEADASCSCVISDIHMPGMGGLRLARLLTARARRIPVVMVTARSDAGVDARAVASGAICLLRKPLKTDALIDCLEMALNV